MKEVDLKEFLVHVDYIKQINQEPFSNLKWVLDGKEVKAPSDMFQEIDGTWEDLGLSNKDYGIALSSNLEISKEETLKPKNVWIAVEESLPDYDHFVIWHYESGGIIYEYLDHEDDIERFLKGLKLTGRITHWMDLDSPS